MKITKKFYQHPILLARARLRENKVIEAYDILGKILEDMRSKQ